MNLHLALQRAMDNLFAESLNYSLGINSSMNLNSYLAVPYTVQPDLMSLLDRYKNNNTREIPKPWVRRAVGRSVSVISDLPGTMTIVTATQGGTPLFANESNTLKMNPVKTPYKITPDTPACMYPVDKNELLA